MASPTERDKLARWLLLDAAIGAVAWFALLRVPMVLASGHELIERVFLLATFVVVPLGLRLSARPDRDGRHPLAFRAACILHPFAAVAVVVATQMRIGGDSAKWAGAWLAFTLVLGLWGLTRLRLRGTLELGELCVDLALLYVVIGGGWLVLSRLGERPMDFSREIVAMTAVHFHYAGFAAPIIAGIAGRFLPRTGSARGAWKIGALGVAAGPILVAIGITVSPLVEVISAFVLAITLTLLSVIVALRVAPKLEALPAMLLWMCAACLVATMTLACVYALGEFLETHWLPIDLMARTHGIANAFGFAIPGLIALNFARARVSA